MLSIEGQFTFTADQPQLHCATFFIGEPEELLTIHYDFVNIDCQGGDFLKVGAAGLCSAPTREVFAACARLCVLCLCVQNGLWPSSLLRRLSPAGGTLCPPTTTPLGKASCRMRISPQTTALALLNFSRTTSTECPYQGDG